MNARALEKLLRRTNPTIREEREALASGRWASYLRERVPPPSRLTFIKRRAWQAAYERALQLGQESTTREALVLPIWFGSNQDDVPEQAWIQAIAVGWSDDSYELEENAVLGNVIVVARLEEAKIGFIMPSRYYAPEIEVPYRNQHYIAVESRRIERVVEVVRIVEAPGVTEPDRPLAPFAQEAYPAVALDGVDEVLSARIRRLIERLRIDPARAS